MWPFSKPKPPPEPTPVQDFEDSIWDLVFTSLRDDPTAWKLGASECTLDHQDHGLRIWIVNGAEHVRVIVSRGEDLTPTRHWQKLIHEQAHAICNPGSDATIRLRQLEAIMRKFAS